MKLQFYLKEEKKKKRGCSVGFKDTDKGAKRAEASDLISLFPGRRDHLSSDRKVDEIRRRLRRLVNFYSQCLGFDPGSVGSDRCTMAFFFNRAENACRLQINEEAGVPALNGHRLDGSLHKMQCSQMGYFQHRLVRDRIK